MTNEQLTMEEIEKLSYYDFMAHMDAPFFNLGGYSSIDRLAEMCKLSKCKKVLDVGCGSGLNACYLAKTFDCFVIGIDVADKMINKAKENAEKENLTDKVEFKIGNAYDVQFEDNSFDVVITSFVSQFLDLNKAFKEFSRVIKRGGYIGFNELYKSDNIPEIAANNIDEGEKILQEATGLPFKLYTPTYWKRSFEEASLVDVQLEEIPYQNVSMKKILKDIGGLKYLMKIMGKIIKYAWKSKKIRERFGVISKAKRKLYRNKEARKFIGYILCTGKKP